MGSSLRFHYRVDLVKPQTLLLCSALVASLFSEIPFIAMTQSSQCFLSSLLDEMKANIGK